MSSPLARARTEGLLVEELPDELLVYDLERHRAHCLNRTAAAVWRACDGHRDARAIAAVASRELGAEIDQSLVWEALEQLETARLLDGQRLRAPSRRQVVRAAVLLPAVVSILAPRAAQAASCKGVNEICLSQAECCPGLNCRGSTRGQPKRCR